MTDIPESYRQYGPEAAEILWKQHQLIAGLERDNDRLRAEVEALETTWISVEDDMPEEEGAYLCRFMDGAIETFPCENENLVGLKDWGVIGCPVTHWMPLPKPPAMRGEGGENQ